MICREIWRGGSANTHLCDYWQCLDQPSIAIFTTSLHSLLSSLVSPWSSLPSSSLSRPLSLQWYFPQLPPFRSRHFHVAYKRISSCRLSHCIHPVVSHMVLLTTPLSIWLLCVTFWLLTYYPGVIMTDHVATWHNPEYVQFCYYWPDQDKSQS